MMFLIKATDTSGALTLHRDTHSGAVKKATELLSDGCWDVEIVSPEGQSLRTDKITNARLPA